MPFDFRLFLRSLAHSLSAPANSTGRWTLKRFMVVTVLLPVYVIFEWIHWLSLLLDEILFPGYRKVKIRQPVFILGVPRSGTTFLHRVMAQDEERFSCMRLWEVLFAPSIVEKKFFLALGALDRALGGPGKRFLTDLENRRFRELGKMHKLSLFEPEEDDPILIHIFSSVFLSFAEPFPDLFRPLVRFDTELPEKDRRRIMAFYRACLQRHLYVFGKGRQFLLFCGMVLAVWIFFAFCQQIAHARSIHWLEDHLNTTTVQLDELMRQIENDPFEGSGKVIDVEKTFIQGQYKISIICPGGRIMALVETTNLGVDQLRIGQSVDFSGRFQRLTVTVWQNPTRRYFRVFLINGDVK